MKFASPQTRLRHSLAHFLRRGANRISPKREGAGPVFENLGTDYLTHRAPKALIIYSTSGIDHHLRGTPLHDPFFKRHTLYWESVEMVHQLNTHGYLVDFADNRAGFAGDWTRYALVLDSWNNLPTAPEVPNQTRVHYSTYWHWLPMNRAELERIQWFKNRTGIVVPHNRQMPPIMSDKYADYLTFFGTENQTTSFDTRPKKHQLNISAVHIPEQHKKDVDVSRKNFLWLGGGGLVHKGLDLAMEAIARVPNAHLYIVGNLKNKEESYFWQWAEPFLAKHSNLHSLGWMDVSSPGFDAIARKCVGILYPRSSEGGPGSVAQALHWGLIPIVTKNAHVRAEGLGHLVEGHTDQELINAIINKVSLIMNAPSNELRATSETIIDFARTYHTRNAYTESLQRLIGRIATNQ